VSSSSLNSVPATTSSWPWPAEPRAGTPTEVVDQLGRFGDAGATRAFLQILDLTDLDHLDLIAATVAPQLSS
jgi:hypothetical protein